MGGIATRDVEKRFGAHAVLRAFSFDAPRGAITLLAGRNGAGKTTWVRLALDMARPSRGSVLFDGRTADRVRREISVVFDEPAVYPHLNGRENLRHLSGLPRLERESFVQVAEMLNLDVHFLQMRASAYSLGQRRRLAVAAALLRKPSYLFLDEPTVGLDPIAWAMVKKGLGRLKADGCAVVLTGQDFSEVESVVDNVVVLSGGHAAFVGSSREFMERRPPRVRVCTDYGDTLARAFPSAVPMSGGSQGAYEIPCADEGEAQSMVEAVLALGLRIREVSIVTDSLEQAFLSLMREGTTADDRERESNA